MNSTRIIQTTLRRLHQNPNVDRFMFLPIPEPKTQVTYIWIDGTGLHLRERSRTLDYIPSTYKDCPNWGFNGHSSLLGALEKSDNYLVPVAMYCDPFRRSNNKLILCETFTHDKKPTKTNRRQKCIEILNKVCDHEVMFGFEQDFYIMKPDGVALRWSYGQAPISEGKSYAGIGANNVAGREIIENVYRCCLYAGIDIYGTIAMRTLAQWQILTGPTLSIKAADDLWIIRYLVQRVCENYALYATYRAISVKGGSPSGLHTNMSTNKTRADGGLKAIQEFIAKLDLNHKNDIKYYDSDEGTSMTERLTGTHLTCHMEKFKSGVGDRTACIRIPQSVADKKRGYFEDRRPSGCADPYNVITALCSTCLL